MLIYEFYFSRFSSLLIPVPLTFKIVVLLLTAIDLEVTLPIRTDILNGFHVRIILTKLRESSLQNC